MSFTLEPLDHDASPTVVPDDDRSDEQEDEIDEQLTAEELQMVCCLEVSEYQ